MTLVFFLGQMWAPACFPWDSFAAAVVTVVVYYLVFQGKNMFRHPLESEDIFIFGEFQDSVSLPSDAATARPPLEILSKSTGSVLGASKK